MFKYSLILVAVLAFTANSEITLSASVVNPTTARIDVTNPGGTSNDECYYQCRAVNNTWKECDCQSGRCNTRCQSDTVVGLNPGASNTIVLNKKLGANNWSTVGINVAMPYVIYRVTLQEVHKSNATIEVRDLSPSSYVSDSCTVMISSLAEPTYRPANCQGSCSPCANVVLLDLQSETTYQVEIKPNYADRPYYVDFTTLSYSFAMEELEITESTIKVRVIRGDAPASSKCSYWIGTKLNGSLSYFPARCENTANCPDNCDGTVKVTELTPNLNYTLALNSSESSEVVYLDFRTGVTNYVGTIPAYGTTWIAVILRREDNSTITDDVCTFFVFSQKYGRRVARCDVGTCPTDCGYANITGLDPGTEYRFIAKPWKAGGYLYLDFVTESVVITIRNYRVFPTKLTLDLDASSEPRGICSYRLVDSSNRNVPVYCEPNPCPTDCRKLNVTNLSPYSRYLFEIRTTYSAFPQTYSLQTGRVTYNITQNFARPDSVDFNVKADIDYRKDVFEDCSFFLITTDGEITHLTDCRRPPCGFQCSDNEYTIFNIPPGEIFILYMNSTLSNIETHESLYTTQAEYTITQRNATLNSINFDVVANDTYNDYCSIKLFTSTGEEITPNCLNSCPDNCGPFTLTNLQQNSVYKVGLNSNKRKDLELVEAYTQYPAPTIKQLNVTGTSSARVSWTYDFRNLQGFVFSVFAREKEGGKLLYGHAFYSPTVSANLVLLPPETDIVVHVCSSPLVADHVRNCDTTSLRIPIEVPDPLGPIKVHSAKEGQIKVRLPQITVYQGNITECYLYVLYLLSEKYYSKVDLSKQQHFKFGNKFLSGNGYSGILSARFDAKQCKRIREFTVGDEEVYNGVRNRRVRGNNYVSVLFRSCISENSCSNSPASNPYYIPGSNTAIYALLAVAIVVLIVSVSAVIYLRWDSPFKLKISTENIGTTLRSNAAVNSNDSRADESFSQI